MNRRFVVIAAFVAMSAFAASDVQLAQAQITSPNNNTFLTAGSNQEIAWRVKDDTTSIVVLQYSTDAGYTWNFITSIGIGAGSYEWVIPVGISSYLCKLRIVKYSASGSVPVATTGNFSIGSLDPSTSTSAVFSHRVIALTDTTKHHYNRIWFFK